MRFHRGGFGCDDNCRCYCRLLIAPNRRSGLRTFKRLAKARFRRLSPSSRPWVRQCQRRRCWLALIGIGSLVSNIPGSLITMHRGERWTIVFAGAIWCALAMALCGWSGHLASPVGCFMVGMSQAIFTLARRVISLMSSPLNSARAHMSTLGGIHAHRHVRRPFLAVAIHRFGLVGAYGVGIAALLISGGVAASCVRPTSRAGPPTPGPTRRAGPSAPTTSRHAARPRGGPRSVDRIVGAGGLGALVSGSASAVRPSRSGIRAATPPEISSAAMPTP